MTPPGAPARKRSGWVPEEQRTTFVLKIRCKPMLCGSARLLAFQRGITLADVLQAGVDAICAGGLSGKVSPTKAKKTGGDLCSRDGAPDVPLLGSPPRDRSPSPRQAPPLRAAYKRRN